MGFRFRRSIRLLPGVRLNVSGSGVSTTFGGRGASVTVGRRGVRANVGIPGTGISYGERLDAPAGGRRGRPAGAAARGAGGMGAALLVVLFLFGSCAVMSNGR